MNEFDFSELGKQIGETIDSVVHSKEIEDLKKNLQRALDTTIEGVRGTVNDAVSTANENLKKNVPPYAHRTSHIPYSPNQPYSAALRLPVIRKPRGMVSGTLLMVFGSIGASIFGALTLLFAVLGIAGVGLSGLSAGIMSILCGICGLPLIGCIVAATAGGKLSGRANRFKTYMGLLKNKTVCGIEQLSSAVDKKEKFVLKDLNHMIEQKWFLEGHIDEQKTCFMITDEAYRQYLEAQAELRRREEEKRYLQENPEAQALKAIVKEGNQYIAQIHGANEDLPGEVISAKLDRLEFVTGKIFEYIAKKPEKLPEIRKFMNYYLPTTLKLVHAYREFDSQPVQGENLIKGKAEIETILDDVNAAFERLFDQLFQNDMFDISTDISVLTTMLNSDGLAENEFSKEE